MIIHHYETQNSVLNTFLSEIRDTTVQQDALRFRRNMERIGEVLGYELSKMLDYEPRSVNTPLGHKVMHLPVLPVVICSVLRAGLPLHQGLLNYFDRAESAFVSAYRHHPEGGDDFEVIVKYLASPGLDGKVLILTDPMLATGKTLENVYRILQERGRPSQIHLISAIGSRQGVAHVQRIFPDETHLWIAAIDEDLSSRGYIIPGLGDAGDLAFGPKI